MGDLKAEKLAHEEGRPRQSQRGCTLLKLLRKRTSIVVFPEQLRE
jgi:hypothetical protein